MLPSLIYANPIGRWLFSVPATPIDDRREDSFVAYNVLEEVVSDSPEIESLSLENQDELEEMATGAPG